MREPYLYAHFPSGIIPARIVAALKKVPVSTLSALIRDGSIRVSASEIDMISMSLSNRNLYWHMLDVYADACRVPLSAFIYGAETPKHTHYSFCDREAIFLLNALPVTDVKALTEAMKVLFYTPRSRISPTATPSEKLLYILLATGKLPPPVPEEQLSWYDTDINEELARLRLVRRKERCIFHIDYILDLCTYCHVSPHFVFSLHGSLLCNAPEKDIFFDYFCLLPKSQQLTVLSALLQRYSETEDADVDAITAIRQFIREEGSYIC